MSEHVEGSVGQLLREAREAQGITLEDVAKRLRLMHRQIEAIEADDFVSLGQPVFARGFVRNYARLMGIQPDTLLARMEGAPEEPAPVMPVELPMSGSWLSSPWLILVMLGILVVAAVPVALYWWLNSDAGETQNAIAAPRVESRIAPAAAPVKPIPVDAPVETQAESAVPAGPEAGPDVSGASAVPPALESPETLGLVQLEFVEDSWTEIKDASGRTLHRQLNTAGSSADIRGQPPFDVLIGNAPSTRMMYNGRPIDLKPFTALTVARFTLEE